MALEELLSLLTGGMKGYNAQKDAELKRKQYQQEQAFKQWQVMSDLENKRAQVDQMREYHRLMADVAQQNATNRNNWNLASVGPDGWRTLDRNARLTTAGLITGGRMLPDATTQNGANLALSLMGRPADSAYVGDFTPASVRNTKDVLAQRDNQQFLDRLAGATDKWTALQMVKAENLRRTARGQELIPEEFAVPDARSASAMGNMFVGQGRLRNETLKVNPQINLMKSQAGLADSMRAFNAGPRTNLTNQLVLNEPVKRGMWKSISALNFARTGDIKFDQHLAELELDLKTRIQNFKEYIGSPRGDKELGVLQSRAEQMRRGASIYAQRANGAFYSAPGVRIKGPDGKEIEDYKKLPADRRSYYEQQQALAKASEETAGAIDQLAENARKMRGSIMADPMPMQNWQQYGQGPIVDPRAPLGMFSAGDDGSGGLYDPTGGAYTGQFDPGGVGELVPDATPQFGGSPRPVAPAPAPIVKTGTPALPSRSSGNTLPNPGAVGGQARAAAKAAGYAGKAKPIVSNAAAKAGVGVKMRKPRTSPKLDSAFGTLGEILKGSPVNPNAGKRPR